MTPVTMKELVDLPRDACWEAHLLALVAGSTSKTLAPRPRGLPGVLGTLERAATAEWTFEVTDDEGRREEWTIGVPFPEPPRHLAEHLRDAGGDGRLVVFASGWDDSDERLLIASWNEGDAEARLFRVVAWHDDAPSIARVRYPGTPREWLKSVVGPSIRPSRDDAEVTSAQVDELRARLAEAAVLAPDAAYARLVAVADDDDEPDVDLAPARLAPFEEIRAFLHEDDVEMRRLATADLGTQLRDDSPPAAMTQLIRTAQRASHDSDGRVRELGLQALATLTVPTVERSGYKQTLGGASITAWPRKVPMDVVEAMLATGFTDSDPDVRATAAESASWLDRACTPEVSPLRRLERDAVAAATAVDYYEAAKHVTAQANARDAAALAALLVLRERATQSTIAPAARDVVFAALWERFPLAVWARLCAFGSDIELAAMVRGAPRDQSTLVRRVVDALGSDDRKRLHAASSVRWPALPPEVAVALRAAVEAPRPISTAAVLARMWIEVVGMEEAGAAVLRCVGSAWAADREAAALACANHPDIEATWRREVLESAAYDPAPSVRDAARRALESLETAGYRASWIAPALAAIAAVR